MRGVAALRRGMRLVVPLLGFVAAAGAGAQEPAAAPLTLSAAAAAALATSPELAASRAASDAAAADVGGRRASFFPALSLDGGLTRFQEPMVVAPLHGFDPTQPPSFERTLVQGALSVTWTVFDGGARRGRLRSARALASAASLGEAATRADVLLEVSRAYLRVGSARDVAFAAAARVRALDGELERSRRMLREGRAAEVAVLRARAALARARADSAGAGAEVKAAEREMARLMGASAAALAGRPLAPLGAPGGGGGDGAPPPREALLARAREANPELARARREQAAAGAARAVARAAWLPRLQAVGRYNEYGSAPGAYTGEWQGGVQLTYPLFTGGARASGVDRAAAEARGARARIDVAEQEVERRLDGALTELEASSARAAALEAAVRQSEEVVRIERLSLDRGAGTQTDYLTAEADLFDARAALTQARAAALGARVAVARITGDLTPAWLTNTLESER